MVSIKSELLFKHYSINVSASIYRMQMYTIHMVIFIIHLLSLILHCNDNCDRKYGRSIHINRNKKASHIIFGDGFCINSTCTQFTTLERQQLLRQTKYALNRHRHICFYTIFLLNNCCRNNDSIHADNKSLTNVVNIDI